MISKLIDIIGGYPEFAFALIYGSRAQDRARADSDLDLAVAVDSRRRADPERLLDLSLECGKELGIETQVRDLAAAEGLFLREVLLNGRVVLMRDHLVLAALSSRMLVFTEDMLPNIRMMRAAQKERFFAGLERY